MRHALVGVFTLVALILGSLAAAQPKDPPASGEPKTPAQIRKPTHGSPRLDVERFIKDYDKNGDGALQKDEVPPYLRDNFGLLDANKDGKLSPEELERGAALLQPSRRPSDLVYILIETSDCDDGCSGEIQRVYDLLRKMDKNQNGTFDAEELAAMRQELLQERVDHIFKDLDMNKDARISRDEARGPVKENFDKIDRNQDGLIDRVELLTAASERHSTKKES